jgi:hypothetical protein
MKNFGYIREQSAANLYGYLQNVYPLFPVCDDLTGLQQD